MHLKDTKIDLPEKIVQVSSTLTFSICNFVYRFWYNGSLRTWPLFLCNAIMTPLICKQIKETRMIHIFSLYRLLGHIYDKKSNTSMGTCNIFLSLINYSSLCMYSCIHSKYLVCYHFVPGPVVGKAYYKTWPLFFMVLIV